MTRWHKPPKRFLRSVPRANRPQFSRTRGNRGWGRGKPPNCTTSPWTGLRPPTHLAVNPSPSPANIAERGGAKYSNSTYIHHQFKFRSTRLFPLSAWMDSTHHEPDSVPLGVPWWGPLISCRYPRRVRRTASHRMARTPLGMIRARLPTPVRAPSSLTMGVIVFELAGRKRERAKKFFLWSIKINFCSLNEVT